MDEQMNRLPARDRYLRDPLFKHLVDFLEGQIEQMNLTPTEIREAAVLAAIHFEMRQPVHLRFLETVDPVIDPRD